MNFEKLITKHVQKLVPYLSARRIGGHGHNFLNANESPKSEGYFLNSSSLNRYPDCQPEELIERYADFANVHKTQVIATRGSDEAIGLLVRTFCEQGKEGILIAPPTYGMYEVAANTNNILVATAERNTDFSLSADLLIEGVKNASFPVKIIFIDSPANPLGTCFAKSELEKLLKALPDTLVVLDEAYIEFADSSDDLTVLINEYENLVVTRTLSKAFALAGIRCGFALANETIIKSMLKVIDPYPIADPVAQIAIQALSDHGIQMTRDRVVECNKRRETLRETLNNLSFVKKIYDSSANFLLIEFTDGPKVFDAMAAKGVILRSFETKKGLKNCVRVSIGSDAELEELIRYLKALEIK
ncbi:MAG: histidinol-phosphate transaminase [Aeromonadales bacterium]|nr:histidinol-phosphate transaminase [Aeromonadales bacterium]